MPTHSRGSLAITRLGRRLPTLTLLPPALFRLPLLDFLLIGVLRRVKDIDREVEEDRPLDERRQRRIQLRREWDEDAGPLRPALILLPALAALISLLRAGAFLQRQAGDEHEEDGEEDGAEDGGVLRGVGAGAGGDVVVGRRGEGDHEDGELHDDFAEVVRVARPAEEPDVADLALVLRVGAEAVFLHVGQRLHDEADGPQDHACDVAAGAEGGLVVLRDVGGVEDGDGEGDDPDPDHLKHPEAEEGEELVALVVEAVVGAGLDDAEEEEAGQARAPEHDEEGVDDLARGVVAGEGEGDDGEDDEVGAAGEVGQLVELEGEGDAEEEELVGDRDEEGDGEVVVVEGVDFGHGG